MTKEIRLPAEWEPQSAVQMTFPHAGTDWAPYLEEAAECFLAIAREIAQRQRLIVVCADAQSEALRFSNARLPLENTVFCEAPTDDTWARDHSGISVVIDGKPAIYDFAFDGWGCKYPAYNDNRITSRMDAAGIFNAPVCDMQRFVLEGGSIESDGRGTILTTARCLSARLLREARSTHTQLDALTTPLRQLFGAERVLWLHHGFLAGDDTDGHIDTLARFCGEETIAFVRCDTPDDEHFSELQAMEEELRSFRTLSGKPYRLLPLPMAEPLFYNGERLPATYANFLIINNAVLVPFYGSKKDALAAEVLQHAFPKRDIVGIDCSVLVRQHGSLHCLTMQFPKGVVHE